MLLYRVAPYLPSAATAADPGHTLYVHPHQGNGRWDNPHLYLAMYVASEPTSAVGESFANRSRWDRSMLPFPAVPGSERSLITYYLDEETHPLLNLDDPKALLDRNLVPSEVVIRNRPHTQDIAAAIYGEGRWSGISWWSLHRPQWRVHVLWDHQLTVQRIESLVGHPGLLDAAATLDKELDEDLRR
jgi:hypothetical protein